LHGLLPQIDYKVKFKGLCTKTVKNKLCSVGASIGISMYPEDKKDSKRLEKADKAVYQYKTGNF